jgi:hypothetical protein
VNPTIREYLASNEKMAMKRFRYFISLMTTIILLSCDNDDVNVQLNPELPLLLTGTFKTIDSENISGTVTLQIANGYYSCSTNLPFGQGAGKIEIQESTINFIDTLFFPIPAIYRPPYVLSRQHQYKFDGDNLKIWRAKNVGDIEYNLNLKK